MKIEKRLYRCGACDHEYRTETNHIGSHFGNCPKCRSNCMKTCIEPEAIALQDVANIEYPILFTTLNYYRYDLAVAEEREAYENLREYLKSEGLKCFNSISSDHHAWYKKISTLDKTVVGLETQHLFGNQWNTIQGLRLFNWAEPIYPNKDIKEGQWLTITPEMKEIISKTTKCGYCGHTHRNGELVEECHSCNKSEYLNQLSLSK